MGLLTSLLPGLRELRAPFTSGLLWLAALYFAVPGITDQIRAISPRLSVELAALSPGEVLAPVAVCGAADLLGLVTQGVIAPLVTSAGSVALRIGFWISIRRVNLTGDGTRAILRRPYWAYRLIDRLELHVWPFNIAGRSLMIDSINSRLLRYWLDLSEREIAEAMGVSAGSVKAHTSRGMAALTRKLEERR